MSGASSHSGFSKMKKSTSRSSNYSQHILDFDAADYFHRVIKEIVSKACRGSQGSIQEQSYWVGHIPSIQERVAFRPHSKSVITIYYTRWSGRWNQDGMGIGLLSPRQNWNRSTSIVTWSERFWLHLLKDPCLIQEFFQRPCRSRSFLMWFPSAVVLEDLADQLCW